MIINMRELLETGLRSVNPIIEKPVSCYSCGKELLGPLPEDKREAAIDAREGETIFFNQCRDIVCESCFDRDPAEDAYRLADARYEESK